jgi:hypothetical protein
MATWRASGGAEKPWQCPAEATLYSCHPPTHPSGTKRHRNHRTPQSTTYPSITSIESDSLVFFGARGVPIPMPAPPPICPGIFPSSCYICSPFAIAEPDAGNSRLCLARRPAGPLLGSCFGAGARGGCRLAQAPAPFIALCFSCAAGCCSRRSRWSRFRCRREAWPRRCWGITGTASARAAGRW